jgi:hypothetical protein
MKSDIPPTHPLHKWFQGLVEYALYTDVGICNPTVADYLTNLLAGFLHVDQIYLLEMPTVRGCRRLARCSPVPPRPAT